MTHDEALRTQLHLLLDVVFDRLRPAPSEVPAPEVLARALARMAEGELAPSVLLGLGEGEGARALESLRARVAALVSAARAARTSAGEPLERAAKESEWGAEALGMQRAGLERAVESADSAGQRAAHVSAAAGTAAAACERVGVLALNVALEGVRVGGDTGRTLSVLGDELRAQGQRAATLVRELVSSADEVSRATTQLRETVADTQRAIGPAHEQLLSAVNAVAAARGGLEAMGRVEAAFSLGDGPDEAELASLSEGALKLASKLAVSPAGGSGGAGEARAREALLALRAALEAAGAGR